MNIQEIHALLVENFSSAITGINAEATDPWIEVAAADIVDVSHFLHDNEALQFNHLCDLCAADYIEPDAKKAKKFNHEPHLQVVYNMHSIELKHRCKIKVILERWKGGKEGDLPECPSVSSVWKIADWHEREAYDMMGIRFTNHPNLRRILCPEDWVGYPLRKDYEFPLEYHGIRGK